MSDEMRKLGKDAHAVCKKHGWDRGWQEGGCYLHLEVSEFIEALRGKGSSSPEEEAGDVLFVLLSVMAANDISLEVALRSLRSKINWYSEHGTRHDKGAASK